MFGCNSVSPVNPVISQAFTADRTYAANIAYMFFLCLIIFLVLLQEEKADVFYSLNAQAGSCPVLSPASKFLLLVSLLTFLSTYVQSLESLIERSTKLGQVKIVQDYFLRYSLPDSLYCPLSGCLIYLKCLVGHQRP